MDGKETGLVRYDMWTLWIASYRWLIDHTSHPLLIYGILALSMIPLTIIVDQFNIERGELSLGVGYTVWYDALLGEVVMWLPIGFYEVVRRIAHSRS